MLRTRFFSIFLCLLLVCLCAVLQAQNHYRLSGTVANVLYKTPLTEASIHLSIDEKHTVAANEQARFDFGKIKQGKHTLTIIASGYEQQKLDFELVSDTTFSIFLQPTLHVVLQEAVVSRTMQANNGSAMAYTNIGQKQLTQNNQGQDLPFLLNQTPSLIVNSDAGAGIGYTALRIRGTDATRINATLNGVPLNDAESHQVYWVDLPDIAATARNIQIQRGVGTSANGAGAFGGSINIVSQKNALPFAFFDNGFGSFNTRKHHLQFGTGTIAQHIAVEGSLSNISSDGYIDRAYSKLNALALAAHYFDNKNVLSLQIRKGIEQTYQAWEGVPENLMEINRTYNPYQYKNQIDDYQQTHTQLHYEYTQNNRWKIGISAHYTKGAGYYEQFKENQSLATYNLPPLPVPVPGNQDTIWLDQTDLVRQKWLDNDFYGLIASASYQLPKVKYSIGGAWNQYIGKHFGEVIWARIMTANDTKHRYYESNGNKKDGNVWTKIQWTPSEKYILFADMQYRQVGYNANGTDDDKGNFGFDLDYHFFNPKGGLTYKIDPKNTIYASISIANREPTRSNLIDNDQTPLPETLYDYEMGYNYENQRTKAQLNAYYMQYDQQLIVTGNLNSVGAPIMQNVKNSYRAGLEAIVEQGIFPNLSVNANATFSQNKLKEFVWNTAIFDQNQNYLYDTTVVYRNTDIAFSPNMVAGISLNYGADKGFKANIHAKYVGRQFLDNTYDHSRSLNPYTVVNAQVAYSFQTKWCKVLELQLFANNIFNNLYEANGWTYFLLIKENQQIRSENYNNYYPQAGVHFMTSLKIGW